jgi:Ca2+-binding EF-hand superfamily protein
MLSELQVRKLSRMFKLLDADANGSLGEKDFARVADLLATRRGLRARSPEDTRLRENYELLWVVLRPIDMNQDRKITLAEWLRHHDDLFGSSKLEPFLRSRVQVLFDLFDADRDGAVTVEEYASLLAAHGVDEAWARDNFKNLDASGTGRLSGEELYRLVKEYFTSSEPDAPGNAFWGSY